MGSKSFGATDTGRVRQNNEDAFFVAPVLDGAYLAACVIDGVGGYEGGEVAAQLAKEIIPDYLRVASGEVNTMMAEAMVAANDKILAQKLANPALSDMACVATLVLTNEAENSFHYVHVGDTRLYLFRDGSLVKVTKDQSFVGFLEDSGRLSEAEAMQHLKRNEIDKALGFDSQLRTSKDYFDSGTSPFLPGDLLLLCSDGLTDLVPAATIASVLDSEETLRQKALRLIALANEAGGKDNITAVLVQHSRKPRKQRALKPKPEGAASRKKAPAKPRPELDITEVPPPVKEAATAPAQPPVSGKSRKAVWLLVITSVVLAAGLGMLLYLQWTGKKEVALKAEQTEAARNLMLLIDSSTGDTLTVSTQFLSTPIILADSLRLQADTLRIRGNGLHLKAAEGYRGAGILLANTNRLLLLQDVVLENFAVGLLAKNQTVRLKNVRFINCVVPVQYGYSVPVNSPINLTIEDSLFSTKDSLAN